MSKSFLSVALLAMSTIAASAADVESVITGGKPAETQLSGCKDNDFSVVNTDFSKETDLKIRLAEKLGIAFDDSTNEMKIPEGNKFIQEKPRHRRNKM